MSVHHSTIANHCYHFLWNGATIVCLFFRILKGGRVPLVSDKRGDGSQAVSTMRDSCRGKFHRIREKVRTPTSTARETDNNVYAKQPTKKISANEEKV
jgi:hypothetical protein